MKEERKKEKKEERKKKKERREKKKTKTYMLNQLARQSCPHYSRGMRGIVQPT